MNSFTICVFILYFCYSSISGQTSTEPSLSSNLKDSSVGSQLYCLGGMNENGVVSFSVSQLNTTSNEWKHVPGMSTPKGWFGASAIGKKIYVCGGYTGNKALNLMEVFDCENNKWSELAPMPNVRDEFGMTTLDGNIYVAGGWNGSSNFSSVLKYSPETNTWSEVKAMSEARRGHELVTLDNAIYAIAGEKTNTVEHYSPLIDEWISLPPTHYNHSYFGATSHENKIYILSELGFEVFDPQTETWNELPPLQIGYNTQLVSIDNKLWAVGGGDRINKSRASNTVHEFNITINSWLQLQDKMDATRKAHRAVVVNL